MVQEGVGLVTLRDLLGHQQITSTRIYIHLTAQDLRQATDKHPVSKLIKRVKQLLPNTRLPSHPSHWSLASLPSLEI